MRPAEPTPVKSCQEMRGAVGREGCVQPHIPKSVIGWYWLRCSSAAVQQCRYGTRCSPRSRTEEEKAAVEIHINRAAPWTS